MAYFDWVEELAIDHGPIDNEHRKLVSLVNDMHAAARHPNNHAMVGERMAELVFYTQDHLLNEEEVMATLEKLADLKAKGILTEEEFASKKAELLKKLM